MVILLKGEPLISKRMRVVNFFKRILQVALREVGIILHTPIYFFCMFVFPILVIFFFTSLMSEGAPEQLPIGIVDNDHTPTTQKIIRNLDAFQSTKVAGYYNNVTEARRAVQRSEIYAYLYIPQGTTAKLLAQRQPEVSFYYSNVTLVAGGFTFKDLKTITSLTSASVGSAKLSMIGKSPDEIRSFLQPITIDLHMIGNPYSSYNIYLSTIMIPGILMLLMMLLTVYCLGTELKFHRSKEWMNLSGNNILVAIAGKMLPMFLIFISFFLVFEWYLYHHLDFPHSGGTGVLLLLAVLTVLASMGLGTFMYGLIPSLRMSLSMTSLVAVVGFSACGATFPLFAMDAAIQGMAQIVPLRHYYMIYQEAVFNGFPLANCRYNILMLIVFASLPLTTMYNLKHAMNKYSYLP